MANVYCVRAVTLYTTAVDFCDGYVTDAQDVSVNATSDDSALREALLCADRAFMGAGSLATTALLLSSQFTKHGREKSLKRPAARDAVLAACDADRDEASRRIDAYWKTFTGR